MNIKQYIKDRWENSDEGYDQYIPNDLNTFKEGQNVKRKYWH